MEIFTTVPIFLTLVALLYFVSCRIVDHQIRSIEREYAADRSVQSDMGAVSPATGDTRGGSGATGGWDGRRLR